MITPNQIKIIKCMMRDAGLNDQQYRMVLRSAGGVSTCKDLDQVGFEDVMAVMEEMAGDGGFYWRDKVRQRGHKANERMVRKIEAMHAEHQAAGGKYTLAGLVARASHQRTRNVWQLTPREAWNLIESLKAILGRVDVPAEVA